MATVWQQHAACAHSLWQQPALVAAKVEHQALREQSELTWKGDMIYHTFRFSERVAVWIPLGVAVRGSFGHPFDLTHGLSNGLAIDVSLFSSFEWPERYAIRSPLDLTHGQAFIEPLSLALGLAVGNALVLPVREPQRFAFRFTLNGSHHLAHHHVPRAQGQ